MYAHGQSRIKTNDKHSITPFKSRNSGLGRPAVHPWHLHLRACSGTMQLQSPEFYTSSGHWGPVGGWETFGCDTRPSSHPPIGFSVAICGHCKVFWTDRFAAKKQPEILGLLCQELAEAWTPECVVCFVEKRSHLGATCGFVHPKMAMLIRW